MRLPRTAVMVAFCFLACLLVGCRASKPFVEGVSRAVPLMERDLRHYAADDRDRLGQVDVLKAAAADRQQIAVDAIDAAWSPVKAWYAPAFEADARLTDPKKAIRRSAVKNFDELIAEERRRPFRLP
jgi:hypothetical protein